MTAGPNNHPKRVSFKDTLVAIHSFAPRNEGETHDLFYHEDDYARFRRERNEEIERITRQHLHQSKFEGATRRSNTDAVTDDSAAPFVLPVKRTIVARTPATRRPPRRTGHNSICWRETPLPRSPSRTFLKASFTSGVAFAA